MTDLRQTVAELEQRLQASRSQLSEALEQQTATSEVLSVISRSKFDLQSILQSVVDTAARLCHAEKAVIFRVDQGLYHFAAGFGLEPAYREIERTTPISPGLGTLVGRAALSRQVVRIDDVLVDPLYEKKDDARVGGFRSAIGVPLMRDNDAIGVLGLSRGRVEPFRDREIELTTTFADQAVIAIENARLFDEVQAKTRDLEEALQQQTATSEVLQIISSSPGDLAPVFDKMLENATRVCGAEFGSMNLVEDGSLRQAALYNVPPALAAVRANRIFRPHPQSTLATAIRTKRVAHVADLRTTPAYRERAPATVEFVELGGARSTVVVPMVRDEEVVGVITIYRQEVRPFEDKEIELVSNFAKQAVIAIENARLLRELRQRTGELTQSLEDLRTAQDRLIQTEKLASLGQLTAGIAHEIKNPLNFVNNFSTLSAELIDELDETLTPAPLDQKMRGDISELTQTLKSNLEKVVQHGKRADSIVKNMLLHSRQGSGEHRPVDINAIVDESLNLAYHGARAENTGFNITMHRSFDPAVGMADGYPQEITRALLNLISNGFYAATKRKAEAGDGFEPTLTATTKNLGDKVEIRIRDNGTGIPTESKDKIFNPFFTTKPAGEGTGLGLSMSHDIIVKQHGGIIDVDTALGAFTEFRIILPRAGASLVKSGEHA
jgi:signal transduction histidine kinase